MGMGMGRGRGRRPRGMGPGGRALGPGGDCVCTECGRRYAHRRAEPCVRRVCPACGGAMVRG